MSFNFDDETNYGGMVTNYAYQPYIDAYYTVSTYEYSFKKVAYKQLRFTIFSSDGKAIYSIKNSGNTWVTESSDPTLSFAFMALRRNLPEDVAKPLSNDIESFDAYVQERIAEASKTQSAGASKAEKEEGTR